VDWSIRLSHHIHLRNSGCNIRKHLQFPIWLNPKVQWVTSTFVNTSPGMLKVFKLFGKICSCHLQGQLHLWGLAADISLELRSASEVKPWPEEERRGMPKRCTLHLRHGQCKTKDANKLKFGRMNCWIEMDYDGSSNCSETSVSIKRLRLHLMHNRSSMVAVQGPVLWPILVYLSRLHLSVMWRVAICWKNTALVCDNALESYLEV
jgi:hypothetical protein